LHYDQATGKRAIDVKEYNVNVIFFLRGLYDNVTSFQYQDFCDCIRRVTNRWCKELRRNNLLLGVLSESNKSSSLDRPQGKIKFYTTRIGPFRGLDY